MGFATLSGGESAIEGHENIANEALNKPQTKLWFRCKRDSESAANEAIEIANALLQGYGSIIATLSTPVARRFEPMGSISTPTFIESQIEN